MDMVRSTTKDTKEIGCVLASDGSYGTSRGGIYSAAVNGDSADLKVENAFWGSAEDYELLKAYETRGLPMTSQPNVLQDAINTYGSMAQEEMAIEEMSELMKAILKLHRARDCEAYTKAMENIDEEMADVVIMLTQLLILYDNRDAVQRVIEEKVDRLASRLKNDKAARNTAKK